MPIINMNVELDEQFLYDTLTTFVESGYSGWAELVGSVNREPDTHDVLSFTLYDEDSDKTYDVGIDEAFTGLCRIVGKDNDGVHVEIADYIKQYCVQGILEGDAGHIDAIAADCIVQAAIFGELVYG